MLLNFGWSQFCISKSRTSFKRILARHSRDCGFYLPLWHPPACFTSPETSGSKIQLMGLIIYSHYKSSNLWGWWTIIKIFEPLQRILEFQNSILRSHQNRWSALLVSTSFRWIVMFFSGCIFFYNVHLLKSSSWLTQCCLKNKDQRKVQLLTYTAHNRIKA